MYKLLIIILIPVSCKADLILDAIMAYDTPKMYRKNIEELAERKIGKNNLKYLGTGFTILKDRRIDIPVKYKKCKMNLYLKNNSVEFKLSYSF